MTANLLLEFIGPSGVGKTTFIDTFLAHRQETWTHRNAIDLSKPYQSTLIHEYFLQGKLQRVLRESNDMLKRVTRVRYFGRVLTIDVAAMNALPTPAVLEEGVFQHFGVEFQKIAKHYPADFKSFMALRAFVNLTGDPQRILDQSKERGETRWAMGDTTDGSNDKKLIKQIEDSLAFRQRQAKELEAYGRPVLTLDAEMPDGEKLAILDKFIQDLQ